MQELTSYEEIKARVASEIGQLNESPHPEDILQELADSEVPIYNGRVIQEWSEMPSEYDNRWADYGMDETFLQGGIIKMMQVDLHEYYLARYQEAWEELSLGAKETRES